ncbi:hypothetical protein C5167_035490 [Papaver somniferum]|uniref:Uncharacterized protein n=1 Tax=Papaver somniferum TaxID=3469 RepID=A0A4Y7K6X5_PAPSO|nr:hypothetical protein C5167_035490 [Papaver somniferum]
MCYKVPGCSDIQQPSLCKVGSCTTLLKKQTETRRWLFGLDACPIAVNNAVNLSSEVVCTSLQTIVSKPIRSSIPAFWMPPSLHENPANGVHLPDTPMTGGQIGNQDPRSPNLTNFLTYNLLSNYVDTRYGEGTPSPETNCLVVGAELEKRIQRSRKARNFGLNVTISWITVVTFRSYDQGVFVMADDVQLEQHCKAKAKASTYARPVPPVHPLTFP